MSSLFSWVFSVFWSFLRSLFSFYCSVSLYAGFTNRNARMDSNRSVCCEGFSVFVVGQTRKLRSVTFAFLINVTVKLLTLSHALIQISFAGVLALSFPKEMDDSPRKTGYKEKGNPKKNSLILRYFGKLDWKHSRSSASFQFPTVHSRMDQPRGGCDSRPLAEQLN